MSSCGILALSWGLSHCAAPRLLGAAFPRARQFRLEHVVRRVVSGGGPRAMSTDTSGSPSEPMSSSSLTQTLNSLTATKLQVLSKQHNDFNSHREKVLSSLQDAGGSRERVQKLVDGIQSWRSTAKNSTASSFSGTYLDNVKSFLVQAQMDPSNGEAIVSEWESNLTKAIDAEKVKFEYAELFGRLLSEWIAISKNHNAATVGRKEMHEQHAMFDSHVFTAKDTDAAAITTYLDELFSSKAAQAQLTKMRTSIGEFSRDLLQTTTFTVKDLECAINALLAADLLSNEKRELLKEFTRNKTVLTEVADVLNMHLAALPSWSWDADAIPVAMRRQINGKYRIYMDEEILQAIFLHWIGLKWSVEFKRNLKAWFSSTAWKPSTQPLTKEENERRKYFLDEDPGFLERCPHLTIDTERRQKQEEVFFMSQLPDSLNSLGAAYSDDDEEPENPNLTAVEIKQSLLHILTTECLFSTALHNQFTAVRCDFSWFGPSLPHTSILTVLEFFGVSEPWLTFFQKFLSAPLKWPSGPIQVRKCGVPISHSLSDLFGEALLFCMDYAVNQSADGLFVYRIHDDFWWWSTDPVPCVKAWQEMNTFARLVGISFNAEKTGSVTLNQPLHPELPKGEIKWGLLKFNQSGKFEINQSQVDGHIEEMKLQLKACEYSVFAWVQAYNKYMSSIVNNCGCPPANCFGKQHVENVTATLQRIHLALFPDHQGSVTAFFGEKLEARFGVTGIPAGWYFWPIAMGGLEVKSPFIPQYTIRDQVYVDPMAQVTTLLENEKERYENLKEKWDSGTTRKPYNWELQNKPFLSYEEYALFGEQRLVHRKKCYEELLYVALESPDTVTLTERMRAELKKVSTKMTGVGGISTDDGAMSVYWKWVVACFGEEMVKKWGGLEVVVADDNSNMEQKTSLRGYLTGRLK